MAWRCVAGEEEVGEGLRVQQVRRRGLRLHRVEQAAGAVGVESGVGFGGPAAGDRVQAGFGVEHLDGVLTVGAVDVHGLLVGVGVAEGAQGVEVALGVPLAPAFGFERVGLGERRRVLGEGGAAREVGAVQGAQALAGGADARRDGVGAEALAGGVGDGVGVPAAFGLLEGRPAGEEAVLRLEVLGEDFGEVVRREVVAVVDQRVVRHVSSPPGRRTGGRCRMRQPWQES